MNDVVATALGLWQLQSASTKFISHRENRVYRIDSNNKSWALRIHRKGYRSHPELQSELAWMAELKRCGLCVPEPMQSRNGVNVETIYDQYVTVLEWLEGTPLGKSGVPLSLKDAPDTFFKIGRETARLHQASDAWKRPADFTRHAWDRAGLVGDNPYWGRFWENPGLDSMASSIIAELRQHADQVLLRDQHLDFGLIHADLLRENILLHCDTIQFIDFDDGGFGYRLFELATTLHRNRHEHNYAELEAALVEGYRTIRQLDTSHLKLFIAIRALTYLGWIIPRMHEADKMSRNPRLVSEAIDAAKVCLESK